VKDRTEPGLTAFYVSLSFL